MRLLFDENLSPALPRLLQEYFPEAKHVLDLNLHSTADSGLWSFARANGYCVVTKDRDFSRRSGFRWGGKVLWLRLGNCGTGQVVSKLELHRGIIHHFLRSKDPGVLEIF